MENHKGMGVRGKVLTMRVSDEVDAWLYRKGAEENRSKSNYIYSLLVREMKKEKEK